MNTQYAIALMSHVFIKNIYYNMVCRYIAAALTNDSMRVTFSTFGNSDISRCSKRKSEHWRFKYIANHAASVIIKKE